MQKVSGARPAGGQEKTKGKKSMESGEHGEYKREEWRGRTDGEKTVQNEILFYSYSIPRELLLSSKTIVSAYTIIVCA